MRNTICIWVKLLLYSVFGIRFILLSTIYIDILLLLSLLYGTVLHSE
jgi:hypothetical protein